MTDERRPANLTPYNVATFHAELCENDEAFIELNKSYQNREAILGLLKVDPRFDTLHDDLRFHDLASRFRITPSDVCSIDSLPELTQKTMVGQAHPESKVSAELDVVLRKLL